MSRHAVTKKVIEAFESDDLKYLKDIYTNIEKRLFSQPMLNNQALIKKFDGGLLREYKCLGAVDVPKVFLSGKRLGSTLIPLR